MAAYIARRLVVMIPTLIGITLLVFMLIALSPGGIGASLRVSGGEMEASKAAQLEAYLEDRYGLDDPILVQYVRWLGRISPVKFGARAQIAFYGSTPAYKVFLDHHGWGDLQPELKEMTKQIAVAGAKEEEQQLAHNQSCGDQGG